MAHYSDNERDTAEDTALQDDEALLVTMRARFQEAETREASSRTEELDDLRFSHGDQWPLDVKNRRRQDNRPCLTINHQPQFIRQVTNEQRQNNPSIRVLPADDFADVETAKILQGLIRNIEVESDASTAYATAFEAAVRSGKGYFRVLTEYEDTQSFDQVIKIRRIRNRFTVYVDSTSQEFDGSDYGWGMIVQRISRQDFRALYPEADASKMASMTSQGDGWIGTEEVRLAEYFLKHYRKETMVLLSDTTVHDKRYLPELNGRTIVKEREALIPEVHWFKTNGYEILDREQFPSEWIPIIPVIGDEADINGDVIYSGIVRHSKDSQRMYNYWASSETETVALAPRTPWVGAEGQFEGHEQEWQEANNRNLAYLEYKPTTHAGRPTSPPQRNNFEPAIQGITLARRMAREDMKATTGIYDASLGAGGNETSGRAIVARQREGDVATFHFPSNLARSMRHAGRIIVNMIPQLYSTRRIIRILGEGDTPESVTLNAPFRDEEGIERLYNVGVGRYDVIVSTGPSFATKRQESTATMLELTKSYPPLFERGADILLKNMDWNGAQELAERMTPEEYRKQGKGGNPQQQLAELQAVMPELQQKLQAMHEYAKECEAKAAELAQQNEALTTAAQSKQAELMIKQKEVASKTVAENQKLQLESVKLTLEEHKLELEEQKLALEVAKAQADMNTSETDAQETIRKNVSEVAAQNLMATHSEAMTEALQIVERQLAEITQQIAAEAAARQAPKRVSMSRQADGTLVGVVASEGQANRTVEVRPDGNGYVGEVE